MIRRYAAAVLAASTLVAAWPAGAAAKAVPVSVGLCGPSACIHISNRAVRVAVARTEARAVVPAPALAPYFRLTTRPYLFGLTGYLVPSQAVAVLGSGTHRLGERVLRLARSRLAAVAPYRPRVIRVSVGGRPAADPPAYAAILRRPSVTPPDAIWHNRWTPIGITLAAAGPWADWDSARYYPHRRLVHVPDGAWLRVTPAEAAMLASDAGPARSPGGSGLAAPVALALGACAALVLAAVRRRPRPRRV